MMRMTYEVGAIVRMKKQHPCGGYDWEIQRVGMDFRIRCVKCGHSVMLPRFKFEKNVKKIISAPSDSDDEKKITPRTASLK